MKGEERKWKTAKPGCHWITLNWKKCFEKTFEIVKKQEENLRSQPSPHTLQVEIEWEREAGAADWITEKNAVRKKWNGGGKFKTSGKLTITTFSMQQRVGMVVVGPCSLDWVREGGLHSWLNNKLTRMVRRKNKVKTHRHCFLHATRGRGWWWWAIVPLIEWGEGEWPARPTE